MVSTSVDVYLAAVRSYHIDPTQNKPRLRRVLQGIHRSHGTACPPRRPITRDILCFIHRILSLSNSGFDSLMFWSASSLAFFGFLRVSEFTTSPPFDPARHLAPIDVEFLPGDPSPGLRLRIKFSKTDPVGAGHLLYIGVTGTHLCPVLALRSYLAYRGSRAGRCSLGQTVVLLPPIRSTIFSVSINQSINHPLFKHGKIFSIYIHDL